MRGPEPTLRSILDEAGADFPDVRTARAGSGIAWTRADRDFAILAGNSVELRLDTPIAAAAIRTPDTTASSRGPEWVRFAPAVLDDHAVDRLMAWFALAYRRAGA